MEEEEPGAMAARGDQRVGPSRRLSLFRGGGGGGQRLMEASRWNRARVWPLFSRLRVKVSASVGGSAVGVAPDGFLVIWSLKSGTEMQVGPGLSRKASVWTGHLTGRGK